MDTSSQADGDSASSNVWLGLQRLTVLASIVVLALTAVVSVVSYFRLPANVAIHWGMSTDPNLFVPRMVAVSLFPAIGVVMFAVLAIAPRLDSLGDNLNASRNAFDTTVIWLLSLNLLVFATVILWNQGVVLGGGQPLVTRVSAFATGAFLIVIAGKMPAVEPNHVFGIRTPWTLSDDSVWETTHERAVPALRFAGVFTLIAAFVPSMVVALVLMSGPLMIAVGYLFYVSYREANAPT